MGRYRNLYVQVPIDIGGYSSRSVKVHTYPTVKTSNFSEPYHHSVTRLHVAVLQYKDNFTFLMVS